VRKLAVGNGMDPKTYVDPCVSKKQQERVLDYIQIGKDVGAEISAQGNLPSEGRHARHEDCTGRNIWTISHGQAI
jgi:betaine-aldehyde dehydrogenase